MPETPVRSLSALLVDDEAPARELLRLLCREHGVHVLGEGANGEAALQWWASEEAGATPDLVLLDIGMPGMGGMATARALATRARPPAVVFTTAFDGFAVAAFDVGAVDYVLKPIQEDRFRQALERVRRQLRDRAPASPGEPSARPTAAAPGEGGGALWVPHRGDLVRAEIGAIDRVEAERDYVRLHLGARSYLLRATMDDMGERLDSARFLRLHRSAIVRQERITGLRHEGGGVWSVLLVDGQVVRVGRSYLPLVRARLGHSGPP